MVSQKAILYDAVVSNHTLMYFSSILEANTKLSTTSAAARAIDCITFRKFAEQKSHEGLPEYTCLDAPYLKNSGPDVPARFEGNVPSISVTENSKSTTETESKQEQDKVLLNTKLVSDADTNSLANATESTFSKSEIRQELNQYYLELIGQSQLGQLKSYYVVWDHLFNMSRRYTCIFVCPITLEAFPSGHLQHPSDEAILHESAFWYHNKQLARDSAAAKAAGEEYMRPRMLIFIRLSYPMLSIRTRLLCF